MPLYGIRQADGAASRRWHRVDMPRGGSWNERMAGTTSKTPKKRAVRAIGGRARKASKPREASPSSGEVTLLSGGNPQIAKGYGDAPVDAYIASMPGWKRDLGRRLDALIVRTIPGVRPAVKWNSPFYGMDDQAWFLSFHCFTKYVKVAFFRGASLHPQPPESSRHKDVRYLHIYEDEPLDEAQFSDWVKQASVLPGERM
jgi:hypothetical protein